MCVADHSLTQNFTLSFQTDLLSSQRRVEYVYTVEMC